MSDPDPSPRSDPLTDGGSDPESETETRSDGEEGGSEADGEGVPIDHDVERTFTCVHCGYGMVHEVGPLQAEAQGVCHDCGDWTLQAADERVVVEAARDVADALAGPILTERQALAYLLREVAGLDRERAAEAMDSTPSNVDNLQRRATEKVEDARRILGELERLGGEPDGGETATARDDGGSAGTGGAPDGGSPRDGE
ncbi:hypothetical protein BRD00_06305 [Halobacteriales archaeon QS_8_69_26]|nr:MAG: hypothetical protein BRD00_06305 [Halobacteriales archaeon QS_8_69_26]